VGSSAHNNQIYGFTKDGEFIDQPSDYKLLKKGSSLWSWVVTV